MVKVNVHWKDEPFRMTVTGHANALRNGHDHDLVCCAVSTLVQTLAVSCAALEEVQTTFHSSSGFAEVLVTGTSSCWAELVPRFQMAMDGLKVLCGQYPNYVSLTVNE